MYHGSNTMWNKYCTSKGTLQGGITIRPGTAVFLVNSAGSRHHVGLFIGNDTVIEAKGTAYGVVTSKLSHWDEWGELTGVDYTNEGSETVLSTLRKGDTGEAVRVLQNKLLALGYSLPKYGVDGSYGSETIAAVMAFQTDKGLVADGICGPITQAALESAEVNGTEDVSTPNKKRVIITSSEEGASIRIGNGDSYGLIVTAQNGAFYDWVATAENGWYAVVLENQVAWVPTYTQHIRLHYILRNAALTAYTVITNEKICNIQKTKHTKFRRQTLELINEKRVQKTYSLFSLVTSVKASSSVFSIVFNVIICILTLNPTRVSMAPTIQLFIRKNETARPNHRNSIDPIFVLFETALNVM
jgi:peptidoglycan hydrolase-like protein with peptidoglycan-binding domain